MLKQSTFLCLGFVYRKKLSSQLAFLYFFQLTNDAEYHNELQHLMDVNAEKLEDCCAKWCLGCLNSECVHDERNLLKCQY